MPNATTTQLNVTVRETLDAAIQSTYEHNMPVLSRFKKTVPTEDITNIGRYFTLQVQSNESYGSPAEGAAFPSAGRMVDVKALVNYRNQFASFAFTGEVEDLATNKTLRNYLTRIVKDTTESFDEKQEWFLFGDGTGRIGQVDSITSNDITMLNTVTYSHGSNFFRAGQVINAYDISGTAYRTGDMTVTGVTRSTDVVAVDSAASGVASDDDDVLVFKGGYNLAPQGLPYHVSDASSWLGLTRNTYPSLKSIVHDAASASIDFDMIEIADLKARNVMGDSAAKFGRVLVMHPVQHKNLRSLARSSGNVQFNAQMSGNQKIDLLVKDTAPGGQEIIEASWCPPADVYGLKLEDFAIEQVGERGLYKHNGGDTFIQQIASSTAYGDAKEGRVYWRYNLVCKNPRNSYRIKNLAYTAAETRPARA